VVAARSETGDHEGGHDDQRGQDDADRIETARALAERATDRPALVLAAHGESA
jgi:hypothetical protein